MTIIGTLETIETGALELTTSECQNYATGLAAMRRTLPEGMRLLNVRVER